MGEPKNQAAASQGKPGEPKPGTKPASGKPTGKPAPKPAGK